HNGFDAFLIVACDSPDFEVLAFYLEKLGKQFALSTAFRAINGHDGRVVAADFFPVRDLARVNANDLSGGKGLYGIILVHNKTHAVARDGKTEEVALIIFQRAADHSDITRPFAYIVNAA